MSHRSGHFNRNRRYKGQKLPEGSDNPILQAFDAFREELDEKNDRYERIVKQSRDITIESKRIIFLLHTIDESKNNREKVLEEANIRLLKLCSTNFKAIAEELRGLDQYQFVRAFSPGLQEFIESYTFYEYIKAGKISDWDEIQNNLTYKEEEGGEETFNCHIQPIEFILGVGDLTGEVMRRCINSLGSGDIPTTFACCAFLRDISSGFLGMTSFSNRDLSQKIWTLRQSLLKCETVCYNVKMRGGEAAKWGADGGGFDVKPIDEDEGFY